MLEGGRLRFYSASAELLTPRDLADKRGRMVQEIAAELAVLRAELEKSR